MCNGRRTITYIGIQTKRNKLTETSMNTYAMVYGQYNPFSVGIDISRQILTCEVGPRTERVKISHTLKN